MPSPLLLLVSSTCALFILYPLGKCVYNLFFHPLHRFPGPWLAAMTPSLRIFHSLRGDGVSWVVDLHQQYGSVVRLSPNELSFSDADAFKTLYSHKTAGAITFVKDPDFYSAPAGADYTPDIVNTDDVNHARLRRIFANAFSDRALKKQEQLFATYTHKLCDNIRMLSRRDPATPIDLTRHINFCTFDVMSDLTFGENLNMLETQEYHSWVASMMSNFKFGVYLHALRYLGDVDPLLKYIAPARVMREHEMHKAFARQRVDRRLDSQSTKPDIWGLVLDSSEGEKGEEQGMTRKEMYAHSLVFMIAGTETTATLLSGLIFYLLNNPKTLETLTHEIRTAFNTQDDITIEGRQSLKYLRACVEEGLRMYPPVSNGLPRVVPQGGAMISGHEVPAGAKVMVTQLAAYRDPENFRDPFSFLPERWLPEHSSSFPTDKRHALQPFSLGPRVCLGKNMAYHEIRIILGNLLWNFDLSLSEQSRNWNQQKTYLMWEKPPLYCHVVERRHGGK